MPEKIRLNPAYAAEAGVLKDMGLFWQPREFYGVNPHELPGFFRDLCEILKKGKLLILVTRYS